MKYVLLLSFCISLINANESRLFAKIYSTDNLTSNSIKLFEDETVTINGLLLYSIQTNELGNENLILSCWMSYEKVGALLNWTDKIVPTPSFSNLTLPFELTVFAKRLGGSQLICSVNMKKSFSRLYETNVAKLLVSRKSTVAELVFRIVVSIFVIFLTFTMACGLDKTIILGYLKKPVSPLIGFCSQFIFMPLISTALGKLTGIHYAFGLGLLTIGCSPGGGASNVWTILYGGDINLSITMTFISSCAALGMMPFWLFVLSRVFVNPNNVYIPYENICLNLLQIVVPVGFGLAFRWKWKDKADILSNKVKIMGLIFVLFILTFGSYANYYIFKLMGDYLFLLPIGAMLPWLGFLFGFLLSLVTRRTKPQSIAISLETGFQNIGIAILILKFSMPQPDGDLGAVMPVIVALFTPVPLYIGYVIMLIKRKCFKQKVLKINVNMNTLVDKELEITSDQPV